MIEISKFYSNIANIGSEDNVNMAGTDTVCNIGSQRGDTRHVDNVTTTGTAHIHLLTTAAVEFGPKFLGPY